MHKILVYSLLLLFITSCSQSKKELYKETDAFVQSLETDYESYGLFGGDEHSKTTSDQTYRIRPVGRLINVKILKESSNEAYEELKDDLENHYKGDKRVNDVYICKAGTIMIDCRN